MMMSAPPQIVADRTQSHQQGERPNLSIFHPSKAQRWLRANQGLRRSQSDAEEHLSNVDAAALSRIQPNPRYLQWEGAGIQPPGDDTPVAPISPPLSAIVPAVSVELPRPPQPPPARNGPPSRRLLVHTAASPFLTSTSPSYRIVLPSSLYCFGGGFFFGAAAASLVIVASVLQPRRHTSHIP